MVVGDADPVRTKLLSQPWQVWTEADFGTRKTYEASDVYRMSSSFGDPASVMLSGLFHIDSTRHSAFALYRTSCSPFDEGERAFLQSVFCSIGAAIGNCIRFEEVARRADLLDGLFALRGVGVVVCDTSGRELMRNERARDLLSTWFDRPGRERCALPPALQDRVRAPTNTAPLDVPAPLEVRRRGKPATLRIAFNALRGMGDRRYLTLLLEVDGAEAESPPHWARVLTPRELQVAELVRNGWDNATIAAELACAAGTVKKHLQSILDKLGVDNRLALIAHATEAGRTLESR